MRHPENFAYKHERCNASRENNSMNFNYGYITVCSFPFRQEKISSTTKCFMHFGIVNYALDSLTINDDTSNSENSASKRDVLYSNKNNEKNFNYGRITILYIFSRFILSRQEKNSFYGLLRL